MERAETETLAARKQTLMDQSFRVAKRALNRIEDGIDTAPVAVAVPVYGVCVEKALLLAGAPTQIVEVQLSADSILDRIEQLGQQLKPAKPANVISEQPALTGA